MKLFLCVYLAALKIWFIFIFLACVEFIAHRDFLFKKKNKNIYGIVQHNTMILTFDLCRSYYTFIKIYNYNFKTDFQTNQKILCSVDKDNFLLYKFYLECHITCVRHQLFAPTKTMANVCQICECFAIAL